MRPSTFGKAMRVFSTKAVESCPTARLFIRSSVAMQNFIVVPHGVNYDKKTAHNPEDIE